MHLRFLFPGLASLALLATVTGKAPAVDDYLLDLQVVAGRNANLPAPWRKIPVDLNLGAGGDFLYLFKQVGPKTAGKLPIAEVHILEGKNAKPPGGWQKINVDLNRGAGGKYLWLAYRRGDSLPLRDVDVVAYPSAAVARGLKSLERPCWKTNGVDLNLGAGGRFIYLIEKRIEPASWMGSHKTLLANKPLNRIVIPAAHDAGMYRFSHGSDLAPDATEQMVKIFKYAGSLGKIAGPSVSALLAQTQQRDFGEQLLQGIRYFDLRPAIHPDGRFYCVHGWWGPPLEECLEIVRRFTDRYPDEVVFLGFNHFWDRRYQLENKLKQGEGEGMTRAHWESFFQSIERALGDRMVASSRFTPESSLGSLWNSRTPSNRNQVVVLLNPNGDVMKSQTFQDALRNRRNRYWLDREAATWFSTPDTGSGMRIDMKGYLNKLGGEIAKANTTYRGKFFATRTVVTPVIPETYYEMGKNIGRVGGGKILSGLTKVLSAGTYHVQTSAVTDLRGIADQTNPIVLRYLESRTSPLNFIWADFYDRSNVVEFCLKRNGIRVP